MLSDNKLFTLDVRGVIAIYYPLQPLIGRNITWVNLGKGSVLIPSDLSVDSH